LNRQTEIHVTTI